MRCWRKWRRRWIAVVATIAEGHRLPGRGTIIRSAPQIPAPARARLVPSAALRHGILINLSNPKMAAFFTSLLPQFVPSGEASFWSLLGLGLTFCGLTLAWLTVYAIIIARAGDLLRIPR